MFDELVAWGWLPVAVPLLLIASARLARWWLPDAAPTHRLAGAAVIAMSLVHASVGTLGTLGLLSRAPLLLVLVALAVVPLRGVDWSPRTTLVTDAFRASPVAMGLLLVTLVLATVTARILPIWQWDAYGYHLPFVNFVLQSHGFSGVPPDLRYITTYPHNIELGMVWLRAMLPDDRLVDLAQVPYGVAAATLCVAFARRFGASRELSLLTGAGWLTLPSVFLQLPTDYVDVGTAAALLGALYFLFFSPAGTRTFTLGALALGLFLGSKPSAPLAVVFIGGLAVVRAVRARQWRALAALIGLSAVFGAEMYAVMLVRHGNPVWPVAVHLGPVSLPGDHSVEELLAAGSSLPRATGNVLQRLSVSWLAIDSLAVFDMRVGGFGLLFLVALPLAVLGVVRKRSAWVVLALFATLLSPDPSVARYVLAFPALMLALAAAEVGPRFKWLATGTALLAVGWQLQHAWPGLVGDGPSWQAFFEMNDGERRVGVGPYGQPTDYPPAWARVADGEAAAFDVEFEFPGLVWSPDLRYPVYAMPRHAAAATLESWLDAHRVRLAAVGEDNARLLARAPDWERLFDCRSGPCAVFVRRDAFSAR